MSSPSSGYNSSGTGGSQEDEGRNEVVEEEERLLIDLSSPGEKDSVTLIHPAGPSLAHCPGSVSRQSWTTFDDDDQNNAFNRYYILVIYPVPRYQLSFTSFSSMTMAIMTIFLSFDTDHKNHLHVSS